MEDKELFYRLALSQVNGIGAKKQKLLINAFGSALQVFEASRKKLNAVEGIHESNAIAIKEYKDFKNIESEIKQIEKYNINTICFDSKDFPSRLNHCSDGPAMLFQRGNANLNHARAISIIGTRTNTEYGRKVCEELIADLQESNIMVFSGLAFGIDIIAHKAALKYNIPTVGVLAQGLSSIYPPAHKNIALSMLEQGALVSEYFSIEKAEKGNFPSRNRIVAGVSDATIVIETDIKGGSMITAELAYGYNRDIFCFPGRSIDGKSAGCNHLIKTLKANLVTCAKDLTHHLNWDSPKIKKNSQRQLFVELTKDEEVIVQVLNTKEQMHIDELHQMTGLSYAQVSSAILMLEMQNLLKILPGKMICLC